MGAGRQGLGVPRVRQQLLKDSTHCKERRGSNLGAKATHFDTTDRKESGSKVPPCRLLGPYLQVEG